MRSIIKEKNGAFADVFIFIIMSFAIVLFLGIMYYGFTKVDTVLSSVKFDIGTGEHATNFSNIVDSTWGEVYDGYGKLKTMAYVLIFGMILTILVSAWAVKSPPIFLVIYILVSIGAIIVGAYISNIYQGLLLNADFGSTLQSFKGASYMILYLPYLAGVVALFSGLISLIPLNKSRSKTRYGDVPL
jgi:hypothetical protein